MVALTPAKLAANRRNAQKSSGPKTAQGSSFKSLGASAAPTAPKPAHSP
jgi:hypothetical protein